MAQTLLYSGSIYGVTVYVQTKFAEIRSQLFGTGGGGSTSADISRRE